VELSTAAMASSCGGNGVRDQIRPSGLLRQYQGGAREGGEAAGRRNWTGVLWRRLILPACWSCATTAARGGEEEEDRQRGLSGRGRGHCVRQLLLALATQAAACHAGSDAKTAGGHRRRSCCMAAACPRTVAD